MSSFDDYMDDLELMMLDDLERWKQDENEIAVEVFEDYRVPDDQGPEELEDTINDNVQDKLDYNYNGDLR
jgi:hypothetical protein